ncbi:purple acid phosphatase family protein [Acidaminococcus fermentans]|uniref:Metallophosphoesterase n=1 Tax=Acidaminococcus fermentans (strain ATCC 25085 / DSM 20731 / CCUG 9996 / CIP 106432 / VR4) TaxID=591001 RepID=D2RNV9_ACIFV|nr:metallophosphoesterase family protein [Acidaminococcus fermentans]ADB46735.1 metallophosphoesterase [Acidaminococcus fermentans DSM 20731]UEA72664.1 metallophosphoesterase family protein [Acidaminococcus fermentans DSM 20731]
MKRNVSIKNSRILVGILVLLGAVLAGTWRFSPWFRTWAMGKAEQARGAAIHYDLLDEVEARNIRQVMTADPAHSRVIMWQSDYAVKEPVLEYRMEGKENGETVPVQAEKFTDGGKNTWIYRARISGLEPGQTYGYRIRDGKKATAWMSLKAFAGNTFKALVFPDSQSADYSAWKATAQPAWQRNQDAQFFVNMGDQVDNGQDASQWNAWFDVVEPMAEKIPMATTVGNHETYDLNWKVRRPEAYMKLFNLPQNGYAQYPNRFYSFTVGDVHFVVLDTVFSEMKDLEPNLEQDEIQWFRKDMEQNRQKWNIVVMHKDPLRYAFNPATGRTGRDEGIEQEGKVWMPLFDEYGIDLVLSAHLHTYRNRGHIRDFRHNPDGPLYILTGVAGDVRYPGLWKQHPLDEYVAPQPETDNYLVMTKTDDELQLQAFLPDGTLLDTATMEKKAQ